MTADLSFRSARSTDRFYTDIHLSMLDHAKRTTLPPGKRFFADWLQSRFAGANRALAALDAGCGAHALNALTCQRREFGEVCAIDLNHEAVERVMAACPGIDIIQGSLMDLPYADARFDLVVCAGVAHHTPDVEKSVSEIFRVLKPGGVAYVSIYSFHKSGFEYFVRALRWLGRAVSFRLMHRLFSGITFVNNFILDHMYVPVLWVFSAEEVRSMIGRCGGKVDAEWSIDYGIPTIPLVSRLLFGDGLIRVYECTKRS